MIVPGVSLARTEGTPATAGVPHRPPRNRIAETPIPS